METTRLISLIEAQKIDPILVKLYGKQALNSERARWLALARETPKLFAEAKNEMRIFSAAGRTELAGNHTDHNHGRVIAASIQLDALAFVAPRNDNSVLFRSAGYPDVHIDIGDTAVLEAERGKTEALVRGIAGCFIEKGLATGGWVANVHNKVLAGSGLSSSAAIEVLVASIFNSLYNDNALGPLELAIMGQRAENHWFGKPCGLMDQIACASGGAVAINFENPEKPELEKLPFNPQDAGLCLCVLNTGGSHADLTADYAAIPQEMKALAQSLGAAVLRETSKEAVLAQAAELRKRHGDRAVLRALHYFDENKRVQAMRLALKENRLPDFIAGVNESGRSSVQLLQNIYSPAAPQEQGIGLGLALTENFLARHSAKEGACRVHGGGFAGTVQAYIPQALLQSYTSEMEGVFGKNAVSVLHIRSFGAGEIEI